MDIVEALKTLGVNENTLAPEQKRSLDEDGLLHLRGVLSPAQVDAVNRRLAELLAAEGENAGKEVHQEAGADRLADLINKGTMFHVILSEPRVLAAVAHVLKGDFKLSANNSRAAQPGLEHQGLHADWSKLETPGDYQVCNSVWMLDDFTGENGATRVVPGSHRSARTPAEEMADPAADHPRQQLLLGKAGDVIVFNGHVWHGGMINRTSQPRRAFFGYYCRRHLKPQTDQVKYLRPQTREQLSQAQRVVLGV